MDNTYTGPKYSEAEIKKMVSGSEVHVEQIVIDDVKGDGVTFKKYGIIAILFSVVYTFCLYRNLSGITYPFFMALSMVLLHGLRKKDCESLFSSKANGKGLGMFYVIALMALSIHRCMSTSTALLVLDSLAIFLLFFSFVLYLYVDTTGWDIAGWLGGIILSVVLPISHFVMPFYDFGDWVKNRNGEMEPEKKQTVMAVVIGVVCAIPALVVIVSLLSSADMVFSRLLEKVFSAIRLPDNFTDIIGIIATLVVSFMAAYLIPYSLNKGEIRITAKGEGKSNPVIAITFTAILGGVYVVFCLIQVLFLFTGTIKLPAGYTYAQYAHEGFYQLLAVCLINIVMVLVCMRGFKKSRALTGILVVIAGCTYIMIASSAMRMLLYIQVYNLTFLRLFVLWFLAVLCVWLAFLMVSMFNTRFPVFKACMVTITVAYIGFIFANPDYQIARYDLAAVENGKVDEYESVETYILNNLSTDAAPALAGKNIIDRFDLYVTSRYDSEDYEGFRKYNFSYYRAKKLFE